MSLTISLFYVMIPFILVLLLLIMWNNEDPKP
jgi:hypothetical protein